MPDFQLTFMRCFIQFLFLAIYFCYRRRLPRVKRQHWLWLFLYCFFVNVFNFTNYMAVNYIAAGVASAIRRSVKVFLFNCYLPATMLWADNVFSCVRLFTAVGGGSSCEHCLEMFKLVYLELTRQGPPSWLSRGCLPRGCLPGGCLLGRGVSARGCLPRGCLPRGAYPPPDPEADTPPLGTESQTVVADGKDRK